MMGLKVGFLTFFVFRAKCICFACHSKVSYMTKQVTNTDFSRCIVYSICVSCPMLILYEHSLVEEVEVESICDPVFLYKSIVATFLFLSFCTWTVI